MKNRLFVFFTAFFFCTASLAENVSIEAKNITLDKDQEISIFENDVTVKTKDKIIKSEYVRYNKKKGILIIKENISVRDNQNNLIKAEYANYDEINKIFKTQGPTEILTAEKYLIETSDIVLVKQNFIKSEKNTTIIDQDNNKILLGNFDYLIKENIFKSIGLIKVKDNNNNSYEFSQIYIDTKKKEILGTDIKAFLNNPDFKINKKNEPRIYANTLKIDNKNTSFDKSIFTYCNYRENEKCPPWTIQASKMLHDNKKKTIYYNNAVIKVYNIPIFFFPRLSHPDPTVDRRSGFLIPNVSNTKNLGLGVTVPYFFAVDDDKDFTLTNRFYNRENPLLLGEYRQAFKNSNLILDLGFTEGYKTNSTTKKKGAKSHFFSKFTKNFSNENSDTTIDIKIQNVSDDKYLKLYKINTDLVEFDKNELESSFNLSRNYENSFLGINASIYETLQSDYDDKYEYIFPEVTLDKNLLASNNYGYLDLTTNFKAHNFDTNKTTKFLTNEFNWTYDNLQFDSGLNGKILGHFRNINYDVKNVEEYKKDTTNEFFGAIGYLAKIDFFKKLNNSSHFLKPKFLLRYAPGQMRKEEGGTKLNSSSIFSMDRLNNLNNFETGLSSTIGFEYKIKDDNNENKTFDFSIGQIINEKENKKIGSTTSLDEKLSDVAGQLSVGINKNLKLNHSFLLDQNYQDLNYNELGISLTSDFIKFDLDYLQEKKHIGNNEYVKAKFNLIKNGNDTFSFETKRNLITSSSEYYDLSYEYMNDCLRAGLVYRREFYNDSELEPENSLMFKITLVPFGNLNSPSFNK